LLLVNCGAWAFSIVPIALVAYFWSRLKRDSRVLTEMSARDVRRLALRIDLDRHARAEARKERYFAAEERLYGPEASARL
jgi:hypothetical protein